MDYSRMHQNENYVNNLMKLFVITIYTVITIVIQVITI